LHRPEEDDEVADRSKALVKHADDASVFADLRKLYIGKILEISGEEATGTKDEKSRTSFM
jgi:hypothetical protein